MEKDKVRLIPKGSVILEAKPFAYVLKSSLQSQLCDCCLKRLPVRRCSGCKFVFFCGINCQTAAWNAYHSYECTGFKKIYPRTVPDTARLLGKLVMKLKKDGNNEKGIISPTRSRMFKDLMNHYSDIKNDTRRMEHFQSLVLVLQAYLGSDVLPNSAELLGIFGRLCINSFSILDSEMLSIGTGLYLAPSIIDHSCAPNAIALFEGPNISIKTLVDLTCLNWSKVRISYIELLSTTEERKNELLNTYYFICDCSRCSSNTPVNFVVCEECHESVQVSRNHKDFCDKCKHEVSAERKEKYWEEYEISKEELDKMNQVAYLDITKQCLRRQEGLFHPSDLIHAKLLDSTFDCAIQLNQWATAEETGTKLTEVYEYYFGNIHPLLGILYLKISKLKKLFGKYQEASFYLTEASRVLQVTHPPTSSLFKETIIPLQQELSSYKSI